MFKLCLNFLHSMLKEHSLLRSKWPVCLKVTQIWIYACMYVMYIIIIRSFIMLLYANSFFLGFSFNEFCLLTNNLKEAGSLLDYSCDSATWVKEHYFSHSARWTRYKNWWLWRVVIKIIWLLWHITHHQKQYTREKCAHSCVL